MSWHLVVHYLDDFRHANAFTWAWQTWIGNVSAGVIISAVTVLAWPRLRHAVEKFIKNHFHDAELHDKLDEIIRHHKDHSEKLDAIIKHNGISTDSRDSND